MAGANAAPRLFTIAGIECVSDVHAFGYIADGNERFFVECFRVVAQADDDLRRAAVWIFESEEDRAAYVRLDARIVGNRARPPGLRNFRIPIDAKLRPLTGHHAEDRRVVVVTTVDQIEEAIGAMRGPGAMYIDKDRSPGGLQLDREIIGST